MIIGISGKKQSGKDTVALIIQYLISINKDKPADGEWSINNFINTSDYKVVRFADKLKDIVCMLTGCTREELEDEEFKNRILPPAWTRFSYAIGHTRDQNDNIKMTEKLCDREMYNIQKAINWQTAYRHEFTYRSFLQFIGTDLFREQLHYNTWVNATMSDYKGRDVYEGNRFVDRGIYPKWIIPDVRFVNEVDAIKSRGGFVIRINRSKQNDTNKMDSHVSETALDDYDNFDCVINNDGTIEQLINKVANCLKHFSIYE